MEDYLRLKEKISQKEQELAILRLELQRICPHPKLEKTEYYGDDWGQNRTHFLAFRCEICGFVTRMTKEEYEAAGGASESVSLEDA